MLINCYCIFKPVHLNFICLFCQYDGIPLESACRIKRILGHLRPAWLYKKENFIAGKVSAAVYQGCVSGRNEKSGVVKKGAR